MESDIENSFNPLKLDYETVELFLACRDLKSHDILSLPDPKLKVYLKNGFDPEKFIGETEYIKDRNNPNFSKSFSFNYIFEVPQSIRIELFDYNTGGKDEYIAEISVSVGSIIGSNEYTCILDLKNKKGVIEGKVFYYFILFTI